MRSEIEKTILRTIRSLLGGIGRESSNESNKSLAVTVQKLSTAYRMLHGPDAEGDAET